MTDLSTRVPTLTLGLAFAFAGHATAHGVPAGAGRLAFQQEGLPDLPVWTYRPERHGADDPVLFVMHGAKRNADVYRDAWVASAERLGVLLLVPEFSKADYPTGWAYQQISVLDEDGEPIEPASWAPRRVEALFDHVCTECGLSAERYLLYGHSAGGQFVHRMMLLMPDARVDLALPANSGWYTLPDLLRPYPEGLAKTPVDEASLRSSLGAPVVVLLGDADIDAAHSSLPQQEAARRQGPHRFARGQFFYREAIGAASRLGCDLVWTVRVASGVPHSNAQMAPFAERVIAEHLASQAKDRRTAARDSASRPD